MWIYVMLIHITELYIIKIVKTWKLQIQQVLMKYHQNVEISLLWAGLSVILFDILFYCYKLLLQTLLKSSNIKLIFLNGKMYKEINVGQLQYVLSLLLTDSDLGKSC